MKTLKNLLLGCIVLLVPFIATAQSAQLHVEVNGIESREGTLKILLFSQADAFPNNEEYAFVAVSKDLSKDDRSVNYNIPFRDYAIVVYHDENNNDKFDRSFFGKACENRVFSTLDNKECKNPSFKEAAFKFDHDGMKLDIRWGSEVSEDQILSKKR